MFSDYYFQKLAILLPTIQFEFTILYYLIHIHNRKTIHSCVSNFIFLLRQSEQQRIISVNKIIKSWDHDASC